MVYTKAALAGNIVIANEGTCGGVTTLTGYGISPYDDFREQIDYDVGRRKTNRCYHLREISSRNTGPAVGFASNASYTGCMAVETYQRAGAFYAPPNTGAYPALLLDDPAWRSYSSSAVQAMWPEVESRVSGGNFILELPELTDILPTIAKLNKFISKKKILKGLTLKKVVAGLSEGTLFSEFSLRPLLGDLVGFHQVFLNAKRDVKRILTNEGKPLVSHYRRGLNISPNTDYSRIDYSDSNGENLGIQQLVVKNAWYHATMRYSYRLLDYQRKEAYDLGLWDALGLNLNAAIIWNALPWSFVVDWIARVGDFLDQAKIRNLEPIVSVDGFCHSYKLEYDYRHFVHMRHNRVRGSGKTQTGSYNRSLYIREPYVPDTYTAIRLSGVNTREFILGGSLIGVRR